jgi:hypothetical protein
MEPVFPKAKTMIRNKVILTSVIALAAFSALAPIESAEAGRRGRNIAAGVLVGAAALAIIAGSANANNRNSGYRSNSGYGGGRQSFWAKCDRWLRECNNGYDYSCEKYETRGCTE